MKLGSDEMYYIAFTQERYNTYATFLECQIIPQTVVVSVLLKGYYFCRQVLGKSHVTFRVVDTI